MNFYWSHLAPPLVVFCGFVLFSNSALCQSSSPTERERVITEIQDLIDQDHLDTARQRVYEAQKGMTDSGLDNLLGVIEAKTRRLRRRGRKFRDRYTPRPDLHCSLLESGTSLSRER